jgi:hypothetical protein
VPADRYNTHVANLGASVVWGLAVGASLLAGAVAAALWRLPSRAAAVLTSFGGGLLFAAVALELDRPARVLRGEPHGRDGDGRRLRGRLSPHLRPDDACNRRASVEPK